jgi:hypothetical protein
VPVGDAEGAISLTPSATPAGVQEEHPARRKTSPHFATAGLSVVVADLEPGDVHEDEAALRLARAALAARLRRGAHCIHLHAGKAGVL